MGAAIIGGGALQLGKGGTSGSLTGDIANNGTLAFNRSDTSAFAGVITGGGPLRQSDAGLKALLDLDHQIADYLAADFDAGAVGVTDA